MEQATNQFTKGLQCDTHPMVLSNDTLTDCLNGTLITMNGNEVVLLNDMGNRRVDNAFLPPGYEPVGMKEYGGIIYVAAYNPVTNHSQVGSFPSPERKLSPNDEKTDLSAEFNFDTKFYGSKNIELDKYYGLNFLKNDSFLIPLTGDLNLHVGDKFTVYAAGLSGMKERITNYENIIKEKWKIVTKLDYDNEQDESKKKIESEFYYYLWKEVELSEYDEEQDESKKRQEIDSEDNIHYFLKKEVTQSEYDEEQDISKKEKIEINNYYLLLNIPPLPLTPKNREFTLQLGILNSQNEFVDITKSLVRWKELELKSYISEYLVFNGEESIKIVNDIDSNSIISLSFSVNSSNDTENLEKELFYSFNRNKWNKIENFNSNYSINVPSNIDKIYLKGKNITITNVESIGGYEIVNYTNESELYQFNDGYFIPDSFKSPNWEDTIKDSELIQERQALPINTYAYKLVGPLYLKVTLNHVNKFEYDINIEEEQEGQEGQKEYIMTVSSNIKYNCPDGSKTKEIENPVGEFYNKDVEKPIDDFFEIIKDEGDIYIKKNPIDYTIESELDQEKVEKISDSKFPESYLEYKDVVFKKDKKENLQTSLIDILITYSEDNIYFKDTETEDYKILNFSSYPVSIIINNGLEISNDIEYSIDGGEPEKIVNCNSFELYPNNKIIILEQEKNFNSLNLEILGDLYSLGIKEEGDDSYKYYSGNKITIENNEIRLYNINLLWLKILPYSTFYFSTNRGKVLSAKLKNSETGLSENLNIKTVSKREYDEEYDGNRRIFYHYELFINLNLEEIKNKYNELIIESEEDTDSILFVIEPFFNYYPPLRYIPLMNDNNYYIDYLFEIDTQSPDYLSFYTDTYYLNSNQFLEIKSSNYVVISPYKRYYNNGNFYHYKIFEINKNLNPTLIRIKDNMPYIYGFSFKLYKKTEDFCFKHTINLDLNNTKNIEFYTYTKIKLISIKITNDQEEERLEELSTILFEPYSYKYKHEFAFEDSDVKAEIIFESDVYYPHIDIYEKNNNNKYLEPITSEKNNITYDINSNLYSVDIKNTYKISPDENNIFSYIIGFKVPKTENLYLRGLSTKGNIDFDFFHQEKIEITDWGTLVDENENIKFKLGIKNYYNKKIKEIIIKAKPDSGFSGEYIEIYIKKDIEFESYIEILLNDDNYYKNPSNKIKINLAYIIMSIECTLEEKDDAIIIEEYERDLYNYNKIIYYPGSTSKKELVRWIIATNLFNPFFKTIKDYCVTSTSYILNIVDFEKVLNIENIDVNTNFNISVEEEDISDYDHLTTGTCKLISDTNFSPYNSINIINLELTSTTNIIYKFKNDKYLNIIKTSGISIYGQWFSIIDIKIKSGSKEKIIFKESNPVIMGSGHIINISSTNFMEIKNDDEIIISITDLIPNAPSKIIVSTKNFSGYLTIKNNLEKILNYPQTLLNYIKQNLNFTFIDSKDIILQKNNKETDELIINLNEGRSIYQIEDIKGIENLLTFGDKDVFGKTEINSIDFIEIDNENIYINLFYKDNHPEGAGRKVTKYEYSPIKSIYKELVPGNRNDDLYVTLFPDWHGHAGDDYHYLIVHYSNNPNSSIRGYYDIPTEDYDYLDRNKYFRENDDITFFDYGEDVKTDFSNSINNILKTKNKNYIQEYIKVDGVSLANVNSDPVKIINGGYIRFCKDISGSWYPSKYLRVDPMSDEALERTFYLNYTGEGESMYESYYVDSKYIHIGEKNNALLKLSFRVPLIYNFKPKNPTLVENHFGIYTIGSLKFQLKLFSFIKNIKSNSIIIGEKFDKELKTCDDIEYTLNLNNGRKIKLESPLTLNSRYVYYCNNYIDILNNPEEIPQLIKLDNFYAYFDENIGKYSIGYDFLNKEKELYGDGGYNALYSGSGDEDSATILKFDGNFVDNGINIIN